MRYYLSSYRMGDEFERLLAMAGPGCRVAVVSNALDEIPAHQQRSYLDAGGFDARGWFAANGLEAYDLDLRPFFGRAKDLESALAGTGLVWAVGGNSFLLRRAMRQSGLDDILQRRLADDTIAYGGWSAGACVAGSTLRGLETMDAPEVLVEGYASAPVWDGLGLVPYAIVPHVRSDHHETDAAARTLAVMDARGIDHRPLLDGEAIVSL